MNLKDNSNVETPASGDAWRAMSPAQRLERVKELLVSSPSSASLLEVAETREDGQVILRFTEPVGPERRGTILLDFEELLKREVDAGLTVWLEPLGDKSSLRRLRGIEVKA